MGTSNSCLPSPLNTFQTLRRRSSISKIKHNYQESINTTTANNNKNLMNINQISEDEFLLLPGINRQLAQNIIQYRQIHNGFKQLDEILEVNGITSDIFEHIHTDITIYSFSSSSSNNKDELINLNLASYNELCSIPGLTPNLVTRIIQRRERKGLFRFVEDLLKIKGIDYIVLATIRPYVTVDNQLRSTSMNNFNTIDILSLASHLLETLPLDLQTKFFSSSPKRLSSTNNNNKQNFFYFASWNLQQLTNDKVQNPGVREVICRIILENNFSLIGIQEIGNEESLDVIVQELNNPTIPLIKNWPDRHQGKWKCIISDIAGQMSKQSEYLGFLYDESIGIELKKASLLSLKTDMIQSPYLTIFRIYNKFELVFVNIHLKTKSLSILVQAIKDNVEQQQQHIIIFGDFHIIPTATEFASLVKNNYSYVIQQNTDISLKIPEGSTCKDNIWLSADAKILYTGKAGVIRDNLTNMWIPSGWTWGGLVSDHCPIWIEFDLS